MNKRIKILLSVFTLLLTSFTARVSYAQSVTLGVEFGTVLSGGGDCVGVGVCDCQVAGATGINVQFSVSADGSTLIMTFNMSDLKASQPDQAANFASGSYVFTNNYSLSSNLFAELNLPSGAEITPNSNGSVSISDGVVTVYEIIYTGD